MRPLAAIVLAAGFSSRMTDFKPLLALEGSTFLERAVGAFRAAGVDDVTVVTGHRGEEVEAAAVRLGARAVGNPRYAQGMYTSIQAGVAALPTSVGRFFVLPVDCPLVRPETIGLLARAAGVRDADVVSPVHAGSSGHPPLLSAALRAEILAGEPPGGLRDILSRHGERAAAIEVVDPGVLFDADTDTDLARARELARLEDLPSEGSCERLLRERGVSERVVGHSRAVAAVATALASALNERRQHLYVPLIAAAALLHDIARDEPLHAEAGAARVEALGYPRVAEVIARHMDLGDGPGFGVGEAEVVYLADKLVLGRRVVTLEERFAPRLRELADDPPALAAARSRLAAAVKVCQGVEETLGHRLGLAAATDASTV